MRGQHIPTNAPPTASHGHRRARAVSAYVYARLMAGGAMALGAAVWIARGLHAWANPVDVYADWR